MKLSPFGIVIRKYRLDKGLRLKDMADAINVSAPFMSSIETGDKPVPPDMGERIAKVFNLSDEEKAKLNEAVDKSLSQLHMKLSDDSLEQRIAGAFFRNINNLDEDQKKAILKLMEGR